MTDIKYDPELPFVVRLKGGDKGVNSRFKYRNEAETHAGSATWLEVVDTTPKPKIPEEDIYLLVHLIAGSHFVEIGILKSDGIVDRG